jgi:hypothetical protein
MFANPIFCVKIGRLAHPSMLKLVLQIRRIFNNSNPIASVGNSKIRQNLPAVAYRAKSLGISRCEGPNITTVAQLFSRIATVGEVEAES